NRPSIAVILRGMILDVESPTAVAADFVDIVLSFRPPPEGIRSIFCRRQVSWLADLALLPAFPGNPSGVMDKSSPLTVAGAAADLMGPSIAPHSLCARSGTDDIRHYNRIASVSNRLCDALTSPGDRAY